MTVIERAEQRLNEGEENGAYWAAYLDGAKAQLTEDLKAMLEHEKELKAKLEAMTDDRDEWKVAAIWAKKEALG